MRAGRGMGRKITEVGPSASHPLPQTVGGECRDWEDPRTQREGPPAQHELGSDVQLPAPRLPCSLWGSMLVLAGNREVFWGARGFLGWEEGRWGWCAWAQPPRLQPGLSPEQRGLARDGEGAWVWFSPVSRLALLSSRLGLWGSPWGRSWDQDTAW